MDSPIVIIGCGASKLAHAAPALELYTGNLYRARLAYARRLYGAPSFVLSGLHGLIPADRVIEPYEYNLQSATKRQREAWAARVARAVDELEPGPLVVLASGPYLAEWPEASGRSVEVPARGLTLGASLSWFKRELGELGPRAVTPARSAKSLAARARAIARGERCPDCQRTDRITGNEHAGEHACTACGQQWTADDWNATALELERGAS